MKALKILILGLVLQAFLQSPLYAQYATYSNNDGLTFGLGFGASYQSSDIPNPEGTGMNVWIGKAFWHEDNSFLAFDWKARFMGGSNKAFDHRINTDGTYSNVQFKHYNADFELGLSFNSLKQRTGLELGIFAGGGLAYGKTALDLFDYTGEAYDYSSIDPSWAPDNIVNSLKIITDHDFETSISNHFSLLPTAGFYLGYQVTPSVSIGLEHKMHFSLNESAGFFSMNMDNRIENGSRIDINQFTSLGLHWIMKGRSRSLPDSYVPETVVPQNPVSVNPPVQQYDPPVTVTTQDPVVKTLQAPTVNITSPAGNPFRVTDTRIGVTASVKNISRKGDITVRLNGDPVDFDFLPASGRIQVNLFLEAETSILSIVARNEAGSDSDELTLLTRETERKELPYLRFTNPATPVEVNNPLMSIQLQTRNVASKEDVHIYINGRLVRDYSFSYNGIVTFNALLNEGENNIEVEATNRAGTVSANTFVTRKRIMNRPPPEIYLLDPPANPASSYEELVPFQARVENVMDREDIVFTVNGSRRVDFLFDRYSRIVSANIPLVEGRNLVHISARNESGSDMESIVIIKERRPCRPPVVNFDIREVQNDNITHRLLGEVTNIDSRSDIKITVNGVTRDRFRYLPESGEIVSSFSFTEGNYEIVVEAANECGQVRETALVTIQPPCYSPLIDFSVLEIQASGTSHHLRGEIRNVFNRTDISLMVNGNRQNNFSFKPSTGEITANFDFGPGRYTIELFARNSCGDAREYVVVNIDQPCMRPEVSFNVREIQAAGATHHLRGQVHHINNRSEISLLVNGNRRNDYSFDAVNGIITARFDFGPGRYTIDLQVHNSCGDDRQSAVVDVSQPCAGPEINFNITEINAAGATHHLRGLVKNISTQSAVSLLVNGSRHENFRFDPGTGQITSNFNFGPGRYTIELIARNSCGDAKENAVVSIQQPCVSPEVSLSVSEAQAAGVTHRLSGQVRNVNSRSEISLLVNGARRNDFRYDAASGAVTANLNFGPGRHTIELSVRNSCGDAKKNTVLTVEQPCERPEVSLTVSEARAAGVTHRLQGQVRNVNSRSEISLLVNGARRNDFRYDAASGAVTANLNFGPGRHTIELSVRNSCGDAKKNTVLTVEQPCESPEVSLTVSEARAAGVTHRLQGQVRNVNSRSEISLLVNGSRRNDFRFEPGNGTVTANFNFEPGRYTVELSIRNACGEARKSAVVNVEQPCVSPEVSFTLTRTSSERASYQLKGQIKNVSNRADITLLLNGSRRNDFTFQQGSGEISAVLNLPPGSYTIILKARNQCGEDTQSKQVKVEQDQQDQASAVRINPGNSDWEFCMLTPRGNYNRTHINNRSFSYSGSASSLFFKPIGQGGYALVGGKRYELKQGQYYLFTGRLTVTVSTKNPGAMGQWSVIIVADKPPVSGNGNNRPQSPCEQGGPQKKNR